MTRQYRWNCEKHKAHLLIWTAVHCPTHIQHHLGVVVSSNAVYNHQQTMLGSLQLNRNITDSLHPQHDIAITRTFSRNCHPCSTDWGAPPAIDDGKMPAIFRQVEPSGR